MEIDSLPGCRAHFLKPADSVVYTNETFPSVTRNKIQFLKAGIDYALTPMSTLGISASLNSRYTHKNQFIKLLLDYNADDAAPRVI